MTKINLTIFEDAEKWIKKNVPLMSTDMVAVVQPITKFNYKSFTKYQDTEENLVKSCNLQDHIEALQLLCEQVGRTLFVGGIKSPYSLVDASNWDIEVVDAYYQLVFHKKVLYG